MDHGRPGCPSSRYFTASLDLLTLSPIPAKANQRWSDWKVMRCCHSRSDYALAQMDRASDPYTRQARTVVDGIRAKIPGMSEELFPKRDIWG